LTKGGALHNTNGNSHTENLNLRDRAIRLFSFLRDLTELRTRTIRTIDQYDTVIWFQDIPHEPECHCIAWSKEIEEEHADVWLQIKKPRLKNPPKVPEQLVPWLNHEEILDSSILPSLRENITLKVASPTNENGEIETENKIIELTHNPEIVALWEKYMDQEWMPWALEDQRLQRIQRIYTALFTMYQRQQRLGEAYEVVVGIGYLTWRTQEEQEIKRHIITAQTSIGFDSVRGVITVGPAGEGAKPVLEQDMLEPEDRPDAENQKSIENQIKEFGDSIWDTTFIHSVLKSWIHLVAPTGQYEESITPQTITDKNPNLHFAPSLILRKRTERNILRMFKDIIEQLEKKGSLPFGVERLVTITEDKPLNLDGIDSLDTGRYISEIPQEIYFPLPANDEQKRIAQELNKRHGILVQGPPGTGKSHTIVNLVCHLLANGKRVLVTSHTARALKVLKGKFPQEIADLCVSLLGDDIYAMQSLEDSVRGIVTKHTAWNKTTNQTQIKALEDELDKARKEEATLIKKLQSVREIETFVHPPRFGNYEGTAQRIAAQVKEEERSFSWIQVEPDETDEPPLSNTETQELLKFMRELKNINKDDLQKDLIILDQTIKPSDFKELVKREEKCHQKLLQAQDYKTNSYYEILAKTPENSRKILIALIKEFLGMYVQFLNHPQTWVHDVCNQILKGQERQWIELNNITDKYINLIEPLVHKTSEMTVSGLKEANYTTAKSDAILLLEHIEKGGRLGFGPFRAKVVKQCIYIINETSVNGCKCNKPQYLKNLIEWLTVVEGIKNLEYYWSQQAETPTGNFVTMLAYYFDQKKYLENVLKLNDQIQHIRQTIKEIPGLYEIGWVNKEGIQASLDVLEAIESEEEYQKANQPLKSLENIIYNFMIDHNAHEIIGKLFQSLKSRDIKKYADYYQKLLDLHELQMKYKKYKSHMDALRNKTPNVVSELAESYDDNVWDERMAYFSEAWNWARANRWLKQLTDPMEHEKLVRKLENITKHILEIVRNLAASKAWNHCFQRMTEHERQHLMAWKEAMRKIGKGTGKYASMHRRAARENMNECKSAIPAWIMPIFRVAETVDPQIDTFDVVIIDEASQSGLEALFLLYLAKQIIVVGDDKQISPESIGIKKEDVEHFRQLYLYDIPLKDTFDVDTSFFNQAGIRYGGPIRLREHFRCMPEIIRYSNNLCYSSEPLIPLRQYGSLRLEPVLRTFVESGYQKGSSPRIVNPPEAEAIAKQIEQCCKDPQYDGKTMGVISLLGDDQSGFIEKNLLSALGPEEMEKRQLICGDSYAFQGDERDVIFLSMVSSPVGETRIGTLADEKTKRRFNVAVSRAKDQVWLFHSATLNDLSPRCLRHDLLNYFQNLFVKPDSPEGIDIESLRVFAVSKNRDKDPSSFESWFEVDVFLRIIDRGYRVIPQYEVAGYFIDLVVEGFMSRLAVECDGDKWHGAERYEQDMYRQRMLERCGWTFWRIRGSSFYRSPEKAMEELWSLLDKLKIFPTQKQAESEQFYSEKKTHEESSAPVIELVKNRTKDDYLIQPTLFPANFPLLNYSKWIHRTLSDPRNSTINQVMDGLIEIIKVEEPILRERVFHLYVKASGLGRIGSQILSIFKNALRKAIKKNYVEEVIEFWLPRESVKIIQMKSSSGIKIRELGDRTFKEIPPTEVAALMSLIIDNNKADVSETELFHNVLECYGIRRMTNDMKNILSYLKKQYVDPELRKKYAVMINMDDTPIGKILSTAAKEKNIDQ